MLSTAIPVSILGSISVLLPAASLVSPVSMSLALCGSTAVPVLLRAALPTAVLAIAIILTVSSITLAIPAILGIAAIAVTSGLSVSAALRVLALGKFLVLDHDFRRVDLGTLFVDIAP